MSAMSILTDKKEKNYFTRKLKNYLTYSKHHTKLILMNLVIFEQKVNYTRAIFKGGPQIFSVVTCSKLSLSSNKFFPSELVMV